MDLEVRSRAESWSKANHLNWIYIRTRILSDIHTISAFKGTSRCREKMRGNIYLFTHNYLVPYKTNSSDLNTPIINPQHSCEAESSGSRLHIPTEGDLPAIISPRTQGRTFMDKCRNGSAALNIKGSQACELRGLFLFSGAARIYEFFSAPPWQH